jgi:hypothetical protein
MPVNNFNSVALATHTPEKVNSGIRGYIEHTKEAFSFLWPVFRKSTLGRNNRHYVTLPLLGAGALATGVFFPTQALGLVGMVIMTLGQSMKDNKHVRPMFSIGSLFFAADLYLKGPAGWAGALWAGGAALRASLFGVTSEDNVKARLGIGLGIAAAAISSIIGLAIFVPSFSLNFMNCLPILGIAGGAYADSRRSKDSDASRFLRFAGGPPINLVYHILGSGSLGASINGATHAIALGGAIYKYDIGRMKRRHPNRGALGILGAYFAEVLIKTPAKVFFPKNIRKKHIEYEQKELLEKHLRNRNNLINAPHAKRHKKHHKNTMSNVERKLEIRQIFDSFSHGLNQPLLDYDLKTLQKVKPHPINKHYKPSVSPK